MDAISRVLAEKAIQYNALPGKWSDYDRLVVYRILDRFDQLLKERIANEAIQRND
jgi:hypothetical protein